MTTSFVYKWTDINPDSKHKYYIGSHKGDVDDGYITSSPYFIEQYKTRPADFIREILATFNEYPEAHDYETKLLNEVDARKNPLYYNQTNNSPGRYCKGHTEEAKSKMRGRFLSEESKAKIGAAARGRKPSAETRVKLSAAAKRKTWSEERRIKMTIAMTGKKHSAETKAKLSAALTGKKHSAETKAKISAALTGVPLTYQRGPISEEHRAKLRFLNTGRKHSADTRAKLSAALKGRIFTEEHRAKLSVAGRRK